MNKLSISIPRAIWGFSSLTRSAGGSAASDLPTGAMVHLDEFLSRLKDEGVELTQEYPAECVPIVAGNIVLPIEGFIQRGMRA